LGYEIVVLPRLREFPVLLEVLEVPVMQEVPVARVRRDPQAHHQQQLVKRLQAGPQVMVGPQVMQAVVEVAVREAVPVGAQQRQNLSTIAVLAEPVEPVVEMGPLQALSAPGV
jgi:hypothetical protein